MEQSTQTSETSSENTVQHYVDTTPFEFEERVSVFHKHRQKYGDSTSPEIWNFYSSAFGT